MFNFISSSMPVYCERIGNSFLSEPLNLISNLAYFIAAFLVYKLFKSKKVTGTEWVLFFLLLIIGVGSSLWHSLRNPFTLVLDAAPVFIFLLFFLFLLLQKVFKSSLKSAGFLLGFLFLQIGVSYFFPGLFNGSIRHVVSVSVFAVLAIFVAKNYKPARKDLILALLFYILAIIFRSIDNQICPGFGLGTHFLWHILNAAAAYFAIKILVNVRK